MWDPAMLHGTAWDLAMLHATVLAAARTAPGGPRHSVSLDAGEPHHRSWSWVRGKRHTASHKSHRSPSAGPVTLRRARMLPGYCIVHITVNP